MVYRGKPSAGCEHCRRAKKKCTLEYPACARCIKLNTPCSGYRDTTALQIQDETQHVTQKAEKRQARGSSSTELPQTTTHRATPVPHRTKTKQNVTASANSSRGRHYHATGLSNAALSDLLFAEYSTGTGTLTQALTPRTMFSDSSSEDLFQPIPPITQCDDSPGTGLRIIAQTPLSSCLPPKPEDIAVNYFLSCFTSNGHWAFVRQYADLPRMSPCLTLAMRACGMAALDNVQHVPGGRVWSRDLYVEALRLLNAALRDARNSKTDETLIAVNMLSFYENLVCDDNQSIQSWKAHVRGATQLLKMRGKSQFESLAGRNLFRETRAQVMIHCIWDDLEPPAFLLDWTPDLQAATENLDFIRPADDLMEICFHYAALESKVKHRRMPDADAVTAINDIETRMIQWAIDTTAADERWRYYDLQVDEAPHVWNGVLHAYTSLPVPSVWNTYRSVRIMVTRTQELLSQSFNPSAAQRAAQRSYFRALRRQLTDDICASVPCQLGQAHPAYSSPCVLVTAYSIIWPLFFAGTCALERMGRSPWKEGLPCPVEPESSAANSSAAAAQVAWISGRLDYISNTIGLRWAQGVGGTLRGDYSIHEELRPSQDSRGVSHPIA